MSNDLLGLIAFIMIWGVSCQACNIQKDIDQIKQKAAICDQQNTAHQ